MGALVRYSTVGAESHVGLLEGDHISPVAIESMGALLELRRDELLAAARTNDTDPVPLGEADLLAPIDGMTQVWAAGVTYTISRDARVEESDVQDVYLKVYDAERPELFFKAAAHEVMTNGDPVGRRDDSVNDTPEPELGLVINAWGEIVAYTACNDMSSRSIEGENPLYLPQAKMYVGSCVVAPTLRLADEIEDPLALPISMRITRGDHVVFEGEANTDRLHRSLDELASYLFRAYRFPQGAVLSTGTCLVPELDNPVLDGDVVEIEIPGVGAMRNEVTPTSQLLR